jgi:hypothetical protein
LYKKENGNWVRYHEPKQFKDSLYGTFGWHSTLGNKLKFYDVDEKKYVTAQSLGLRL